MDLAGNKSNDFRELIHGMAFYTAYFLHAE